MRAVSHVLFGTEDYYLALHAVTVYEAITHKNFYLDNVYLKYGRSHDNNLKAQFAIYSGIYNNVITNTLNDNTIEMIYEAQVPTKNVTNLVELPHATIFGILCNF